MTTTMTVGPALETDEARPVTPARVRPVGRAVETDTAATLTPAHTYPFGQAGETNTAATLTRIKKYLFGRVTKTSAAQRLTPAKANTIGRAAETSAARALTFLAESPQTVTLSGGVLRTLIMDRDYQHIEITNVTGSAAVWVRLGGKTPAAAANGSIAIPAVAGWTIALPDVWSGNTVVKLISAGTPQISVRGVR